MSNTPLNPDALEDAADVIWMRANVEHGVCRADRELGSYRIAVDAAEEAISAYLSALPAPAVVETVEQLDALVLGLCNMARKHQGLPEVTSLDGFTTDDLEEFMAIARMVLELTNGEIV